MLLARAGAAPAICYTRRPPRTPASFMKVPLLDLKAQYRTIREQVQAAVAEVFEAQSFILGPHVERFEREVAAYVGVKHAIGVSSGTDALLAALMALGVGPGDEVVTSPYTFFATGGSIWRVGAKPVFVDIDPDTYTLRVDRIAEVLTPRTKAIMPVHLYGRMAEMDPLLEVAGRHGLPVVEDAAQAIGAAYRGRSAGAVGTLGCFSFFPSKNLGGAGDGGLVTTNDDQLAARLKMLRVHGSKVKYDHEIVGGNFRLDALQAAVISVKLKHLDAWTVARQRNASRYQRLFVEAGLSPTPLVLPQLPAAPGDRHVFNQFVVRSTERDALRAFLAENGVGSEVYYPVPLHRQTCFATLGLAEGSFPESERAARETLALPIYPELTDDQAGYVVETVGRFVAGRGAVGS